LGKRLTQVSPIQSQPALPGQISFVSPLSALHGPNVGASMRYESGVSVQAGNRLSSSEENGMKLSLIAANILTRERLQPAIVHSRAKALCQSALAFKRLRQATFVPALAAQRQYNRLHGGAEAHKDTGE
jgi:hypothetical protein